MRKLFVLMVSVIALSFTAGAQKISGIVKDEQGKGMEKSTAVLLHAKDSSIVKLVVTGANGQFSFQADPGSYLVSTSHVDDPAGAAADAASLRDVIAARYSVVVMTDAVLDLYATTLRR